MFYKNKYFHCPYLRQYSGSLLLFGIRIFCAITLQNSHGLPGNLFVQMCKSSPTLRSIHVLKRKLRWHDLFERELKTKAVILSRDHIS